ncbi:MAG: Sapep family Mn(2+)-dependent dipeptidase [Eubacteriales bacterium]|nr:Sapep family Mn(2+)-dependent dipeptidase [Eubacteriales bacterium]
MHIDMTLIETIRKYILDHTDEMTSDIISLCSIDSVKGKAEGGKPYGPGPHKALMAAKKLCESYGFSTKNYYDRVITADLLSGAGNADAGKAPEAFGAAPVPAAPHQLDILAHMDVVAPGDGWTVTEAFKPVIKGDAIYGRGASDDKGPAVAALYAMRAIKELGIGISKNCRLILGSDEECGSSDIKYYYKDEEEAPMTFSPDAEFPLINIEKGQFRGELSKHFNVINTSPQLISCESGSTINIVPGKADAVIAGFTKAELEAAAEAVSQTLGEEFEYTISPEETYEGSEGGSGSAQHSSEQGTALHLHIEGQTAHASTPERGVNAAVVMLQILAELDFDNRELNAAIKKMAILFQYGDHCGSQLGIDIEDERSGCTTLSPDILRADENAVSLKFDSRTAVSADEKTLIAEVGERAEFAGFNFEYSFVPAHAVDADSDFVKTLLGCYEAVTGRDGRAVAIGGGTYVHSLKNGVAFGAVGEDTDTHMHGADEFMPISELQDAAVVYALAIAELCR